jgi:dihydrofolate synthase/folylpolyglutamate synthase
MQRLTYEETVTTIENKRRFGNLKGVEISRIMLEKLGHPEKDLHIIHIAGTNGKGSVSAFLRSILEEAGLKTGMFTSPHLVDFRERIQVQGKMISKEDTARLGNKLLSMDFGVYPTMFDYCLAMALLYFKEQQCEVVILETGLGGTYDSTNACGIPDVTVIAKIGFDHMAILGDTLGKIASEKAGIIKHGTALVLESQEKEAMDVLTGAAQKAGIENVKIVDWDKIKILPQTDGKQCFSYGEAGPFIMQMLGVHQYENAVAAMLAAELFLEKIADTGKIIESAIRSGIGKTTWMGRMELVSRDPFFLLDGAHNSNGVEALKKSLETLYPGEKFHFIMGVMADKDYEEMIKELLPLAIDFKTVTVESERALQGEALAECIRTKGIPAEAFQSLAEVLPDFSESSSEKTVAFGSLYFIGEIKSLQKSYKIPAI